MRRLSRVTAVLALTVTVGLLGLERRASTQAADTPYTITDLGAVMGAPSIATDLTEGLSPHIVGWGPNAAFAGPAGSLTNIGQWQPRSINPSASSIAGTFGTLLPSLTF